MRSDQDECLIGRTQKAEPPSLNSAILCEVMSVRERQPGKSCLTEAGSARADVVLNHSKLHQDTVCERRWRSLKMGNNIIVSRSIHITPSSPCPSLDFAFAGADAVGSCALTAIAGNEGYDAIAAATRHSDQSAEGLLGNWGACCIYQARCLTPIYGNSLW